MPFRQASPAASASAPTATSAPRPATASPSPSTSTPRRTASSPRSSSTKQARSRLAGPSGAPTSPRPANVPSSPPPVSLATASVLRLDTDVLVLPVLESNGKAAADAALTDVDRALGGHLHRAAAAE